MRAAGVALAALAAVAALAFMAPAARAQGLSASYSDWTLSGDRVILRFLLPVADAQRLAGTDVAVATESKIADYLLDHVWVHGDGEDCPAIDQGYDIGRVDPLSVQAGLYGFEIFFQCAHPVALVLHDGALFDRLPDQVDFARVQVAGRYGQELFTAHHQTLQLPAVGPVGNAGPGRYFPLGAAHLLSSVHRWCFLLGSLLLLRRRRQVGQLVAGLGAGYALSLLAAPGGLVTRAALPDAFVGLLLALLALQYLAREAGRPRTAAVAAAALLACMAIGALVAHASSVALLLAGAALLTGGFLALPAARRVSEPLRVALLPFAFGFLDGFVLPSAPAVMQLPARGRLPMLLGFDLGAVSAAAAVLLAAVLGVSLLQGIRRPGTAWLLPARAMALDLAVAALGGLGAFWLIGGLHGAGS